MTKITHRKANEEDVMLYFNWANDVAVRQNAISTEPILLENHQKWFFSRLERLSTSMYIFEKENTVFGQVRFDIEGDSAIIDYSIDKKYRGQGLGSKILELAIDIFKKEFTGDYKNITGTVKESNIPSAKVFERLDFELKARQTSKGEVYKIFVLTKTKKI